MTFLVEAGFAGTLAPVAAEQFAGLEKLQEESIKAMEAYLKILTFTPKGDTYR